MAQIIYRDKKTGRFTSRATWKRSKAQGGNRYVRRYISRVGLRSSPPSTPIPLPEHMEQEEFEPEPEEGDFEDVELVGGFDSPGRKRK